MKFNYSLYLVTDRELMTAPALTVAVEQAILGGCTMIQLREKELSSLEFYELAIEIKGVTDRYHIPLIINDRVDIALAVNADGVHVGQSDIPASVIRKIIGNEMLLGVSVTSVDEALKAKDNGADYLGVGAVFPTETKTDASLVSIEELRKICQTVKLPVVAIGGINKDNALSLKDTGIDGLAVVSAVISQPDIKKAAWEIKQIFCGTNKTADFQAAIFDLDGTMLDSMGVWAKIDVDFLTKRGFDVPDDYISEVCARSFNEAAEYTIERFGLSESVEEIITEWDGMAADEYSYNVKLLPYVRDYIMRLKESNIKLAVATGLSERLYKPCLLNNGIYELFDVLCSTDQVERGKQYPDIYLFVADKLKVNPRDCIVFEDVLPAVKSAKNAGMTVYGVYDEYSKSEMREIKGVADGYLFDFSNAPYPNNLLCGKEMANV